MTTSPNPTLVRDVQALRPGNHQSAAFSATAGVTADAVKASIVRIVVTSSAYIKVGTNPVATTSDTYVSADQPEYFRLDPGEKVSAVRVTGNGVLHVTEMD